MHRAYYKLHNEALGYMVNNLDRDVNQFFFPYSDALTPYAYAPPWTPLNPGFYSISWSSTHLLVLHDGPPWKVALCLPYPTVPSPPRHVSTGWSNQLCNTLAKLVGIAPHVSHIVDRLPTALLPSGSLMECGRALDEPFFGMPTRIRFLGRTS